MNTLNTPCLVQSEFDTRAFGFPYFRIASINVPLLQQEISQLGQERFAADMKLPAHDSNGNRELLSLGFRKVCMQVTLVNDLKKREGIESANNGVEFAGKLDLSDDIILRHARNFTKDRFSLDPMLPAEGHDRLYVQWFRNSLNGGKQVACIGQNVCTFSHRNNEVVIDLTSILDQRQGFGKRIMNGVLAHAVASGARGVRVTTECENTPAWSLYQRLGFVPVEYMACFHLVHPGS